MTSNYDDFDLKPKYDRFERDFTVPEQDFSDWDDNEMDDLRLDCFELLSAYLDGEVNAEERQQVQYWLDNDPEIKQQYLQLSQLHHGIRNIPAPEKPISAQQLSKQVFRSVDRNQRQRKVVLWGGGAIAALVVATISNLFTGSSNVPVFRLAESAEQEKASQPITLAIAVNEPAIKIPKAAVSPTREQVLENKQKQ
ncbi:MAG: hypothetical protein QNJ34_07165 [Xenococcaceae cyanobacterium MO_188.B29]|nr:hypothetical protein [Xenococcaceae cyanobacterium MO_188.B29]